MQQFVSMLLRGPAALRARRLAQLWAGTAFIVLLVGCGPFASTSFSSDDPGAGSHISPDIVARRFFNDFAAALKDRDLKDDTRRSKLAEQLAEYFAPTERDDQRLALNDALTSFADGMLKLNADETMTLELRITEVRIVSEEADRALVRPINGTQNASIYLLISRTTDRGAQVTEFEQELSFDKIFGNADGAIPAIKVGDVWYLTEG